MERYKLKIAVYVILIRDGKILMGRRLHTGWQDGNYGLLSGHLEPKETLTEAILRETEEETSIKLEEEKLKFVHVMHRKFCYIDFFFVAQSFKGEAKILEPDKCSEWKWFPINSLPENTIPSIRHVIKNYQEGITFSEFVSEE